VVSPRGERAVAVGEGRAERARGHLQEPEREDAVDGARGDGLPGQPQRAGSGAQLLLTLTIGMPAVPSPYRAAWPQVEPP
jgi:hypothetical protein